ncbi:phage tail tape measure protein [Salmonella enterica subsp. enterica serovar Typhimurium]|nr:phage tail tape measure protein [Salmonella enterica subsp. enterica serovar Typhimurium]
MDQIANLVIDLSIDSAEFRNEVPRIKKLLNDAAGDSERSAARMQRFLDKQTEATRRTSASLEQVTASSTAYSSAVEKSAAASTRLAADVDQTRQRVEALGRKLREEQAQSAAVAAAQDRTSAAFYRQIDSVKQLSGGLQELQRIQAQVRQAKGRGDISQGDYLALVSERALDNFLAQGGNVAGMTENVFTNAFNGMADSIANFAVTGKGSFRSLTVSILADLAKMEARIAASKLLGSVLAMFGFGTSAGGSTPSGAYSSAALSVIPNADGGVYRSAGLSQYSGSIVNRPTFFAFAKGAGVMGEAGPEAILPLRRGADGKLGVVAAGSGGMAMFAPEYNIEIHNDAGNGQIGPQALQAVYNIGKKAAIDFWQQQSRDGGIAGGGR